MLEQDKLLLIIISTVYYIFTWSQTAQQAHQIANNRKIKLVYK